MYETVWSQERHFQRMDGGQSFEVSSSNFAAVVKLPGIGQNTPMTIADKKN